MPNKSDENIYKVVINHEEQYSIWLKNMRYRGWKDTGKVGTNEECFKYIQEVWTDMRPLSLRKKLARMKRKKG
ncbi:MAG: MbtH family NRPS accessory protein [bacterium]|nr:MbtH family NRPS accessory protein [bacterium]